jgi:hypothetical protein
VRGHALLFGALCAGGAAAAVGLLVHDVRTTDVLRADVVSTTRHGTARTVELLVRSSARGPVCADVRAVAQDREGRDLAASPHLRATVRPGAATRLTTALELSPRDDAERFAKVRGVVRRCDVERHVQK